MFEALPRRPRPSCAEHFAALKITKTSTSLKNRIKELRFHSLESVSVRLAGVQYAFKVAQGPWGGPTFVYEGAREGRGLLVLATKFESIGPALPGVAPRLTSWAYKKCKIVF